MCLNTSQMITNRSKVRQMNQVVGLLRPECLDLYCDQPVPMCYNLRAEVCDVFRV